MESDLRSTAAIVEVPSVSGVSWAAIAAGAGATAALTLLLIAFGAGLGLSAVSPWSDSGVSSTTLSLGTGIYLIIVAVMSSAIGGYLAGRLRTKWVGVHSNEVFFRDSAHGFLAWAFATLISATALASTTGYLANGFVTGVAGGSAQAVQSINPSQIYVDKLFRPAPAAATAPTAAPARAATNNDQAAAPASTEATNPQPAESSSNEANSEQARAEILRLWTADFRNGENFGADDTAYVAQVVAAQTGMNEADARQRVDQVVVDAKTAADKARRGAAHLSFWLTAALLFGAFAASLAAVEGGALRDGTWNDRVLTPRAI